MASFIFISLFLVAVILIISVIVFSKFLSFSINVITALFRGNGEPCPFCSSKHSVISIVTEDSHKKVCKKCGFAIEVSDVGKEYQKY